MIFVLIFIHVIFNLHEPDSPVIKGQNMRSFNKITSKSFLAFLDSLVCVLASQKKFTKNFAKEKTVKANLQNGRHDRL